MDKLTIDVINQKLNDLEEWSLESNHITKNFVFEDFNEAIEFVNKVAEASEKLNHHPEIHLTNYNEVTLNLTTHNSSGITRKDFELAEKIDQIQ